MSANLSPAETAFVQQFGSYIGDVAEDLANLTSRIASISSGAENHVISRLDGIAGFARDVESDLRDLTQQMFDFTRRQLPAPVVKFENETVPVLQSSRERILFNGHLSSVGYDPSAGYALSPPADALRSIGAPLTRFLATRATQSLAASVKSNVTVSNTAHGWTIVYTPVYVASENGFGGPSTPVSGYLNPGKYRFGIKQTAAARWDTTPWSIPCAGTIPVPLP